MWQHVLFPKFCKLRGQDFVFKIPQNLLPHITDGATTSGRPHIIVCTAPYALVVGVFYNYLAEYWKQNIYMLYKMVVHAVLKFISP